MHPLAVAAVLWLVWIVGWTVAGRFVKSAKASESMLLRLQHIIPAGVGCFLIVHGGHWHVVSGQLYDNRSVQWIGVATTAAGLAFSAWSRAHLGRNWSGLVTLKEEHTLVRTGPYRYIRHPLYTGFLSAVVGTAVTRGTGDALLGAAIVVAAYLIKMRREEALMMQEFGDQYRQFRRESAALVPFLF